MIDKAFSFRRDGFSSAEVERAAINAKVGGLRKAAHFRVGQVSDSRDRVLGVVLLSHLGHSLVMALPADDPTLKIGMPRQVRGGRQDIHGFHGRAN